MGTLVDAVETSSYCTVCIMHLNEAEFQALTITTILVLRTELPLLKQIRQRETRKIQIRRI
jgi:hypothetical protein